MGAIRAWIRATNDMGYGSLHLLRAQALAEAAAREGIDAITLLLDRAGSERIGSELPNGVAVETMEGLTPEQEAEAIAIKIKEFVPRRIDSGHKRPLVYLLGGGFDPDYQRAIWRAGAEVVLIADDPVPTWADWFVLPKPYAGEVSIESRSGYTRFLRGSHYAPLRFASMKAIYRNSEHRTFARKYAIATENLDLEWLGRIAGVLAKLEAPAVAKDWKPALKLLPSVECPPDDELRKAVGDASGLDVSIAKDRKHVIGEMLEVDLLFSADNTILQEALALGTVRIALPRKGLEGEDRMVDHLVRREASLPLPGLKSPELDGQLQAALLRASFDPAWRRGQNRIGQYLCDGIGSVRLIRQTAFGAYAVPQNLVRYFEPADPMLREI